MNKGLAAFAERPKSDVQAIILLWGTGGLRAATHRGCLEKRMVAKYLLLINCYLMH